MSNKGKDSGASSSVFKVDDETKRGITVINSVGQGPCRQVLELVVAEITSTPVSNDVRSTVITACTNETNYTLIYSFLDRILRTIIRQEITDIIPNLTSINIPDTIARDINNVIRVKGADLRKAYNAVTPHGTTLTNTRWRIDVIISSNSLNRVMRPTLLMELTLSNGNIETFEVPIEKFHELRYTAAKLLSEMGIVANHPVLRI